MKMKSELIRIFGCLALMLVCGAAAVGETYTLAGDDSAGASSLTGGGAGWKDSSGTVRKLTPSAGNTYIAQGASDSSLRVLRTPPNVNSATVNGRLVLQHASLVFKLNHAGVLTVKDALVEGGMSRFRPGDIGYRYDVDGKFEIASDGKLQVESIFEGNPNANPPDRRTMKVLCELTGDGVLYVVRDGTDPRSNVSRALLGGDFSKFAGPVQIVNPLTETASVMSVDIMNANTFPGAMSPANSAGFVLDGGVLLNFLESGTIDFSRGVVFGPTANGKVPEINVAAGKEVTIESVVSGVQGFVKTGAGKLKINRSSDLLSGSVTVREGTLAYAELPSATVTAESGGTIERIGVEKLIRAAATGYSGYEDEDSHGMTVTVEKEPGVEYSYEWSADGGEFGPTEPKFQAAGSHTVSCRISADGYESAVVTADVKISLRTILATLESDKVEVYDGTAKTLLCSVTDPAEGAMFVWTVDGGEPFEAAQLAVTNPGVYSVEVRVSAPHYATKTIKGTLSVLCRGDLYADAAGGSGVPPYDAPEKACADLPFLTSIAAANSTIHLAPGTYEPADEVSPARAMRFEGPADRSAVIRNSCLRLGVPGCFVSGLALEGGSDYVLRITEGSMASNCCVRDVVLGVLLRGRLTDSTVTRFTKNGVMIRSGSVKLTRVAVTHGQMALNPSQNPYAPIMISESNVSLTMEECDVSFNTNKQNQASAGAIAVTLDSVANVVLDRCRFWRNCGRCGFCRGAPNIQSSNYFYVTNCLVAECCSRDAAASRDTAALPICFCRGDFVNCTFAGNTVEETDGAIRSLFRCKGRAGDECATAADILKNCIVSGNPNLPTGLDGALPTCSNTVYPECPAGDANGNLPGPVTFKGRGATPYALRAGSSGIGAGALLGWTKEDVDLAGHRRVTGGSVDMGCYQTAEGMAVLVR